jgi:hypothetical protein
MSAMKTCPVYLPLHTDANEPWLIVRGALEDAGYRDLRPAPMPAQTYVPRQLRPVLTSNVGA